MLWSVVVCDLLFKLQNLVELYGDDKAKAILAEVGKLRQANERSSEWESKLVELVAEQTQLLDTTEQRNLLYLQQQRHLAAHPVVNDNFQLHRPNRDTVRALIRNALDGLLTKAPILSRKIVGDLVEDLERASNMLMQASGTIDRKKLKEYLESKYFPHFNPEVEKAVFRSLWKLVFRLADERCEKNRAINYSALSLLYDRNPAQFQAQIEADRGYFSAIATGGSPLVCLIRFLSRSAHIYNLLADHAKVSIQHTAEQEPSAHCLAWFLSDSLEKHAVLLGEWITGATYLQIDRETWASLEELSDSPEWGKAVIRLANKHYVASINYDIADRRFAEAIRPALGRYAIDDCIDLIEGIQGNNQTWGRGRANVDHRFLRARARELDPKFNYEQYEALKRLGNPDDDQGIIALFSQP
jgi:hypothetical protein